MAEYIKRQEVCSKINELPLTEDAAMEILWAVDKIPTADVAPVVHGHNKNLKYAKCDEFRCSVCGIHLEDWNLYDEDDWGSEFVFKFCPNCGAKMDGDTP